MTARFLRDEDTGTKLLYPDNLHLSVSEQVDDKDTIFMVQAKMASLDAGAALPNSRGLNITNAFFILRAPTKIHSSDFNFVVTAPLQGNATFAVKTSDAQKTRDFLKNDISFLSPEYSGVSENYTSRIEVARITLSPFDVEAIRSKTNVIQQLQKLQEVVQRNLSASDQNVLADVINRILDEHAKFSKPYEKWILEIGPGSIFSKLEKFSETSVRVGGDSSVINLVSV